MHERIYRTAYKFGSLRWGHYSEMALGPDGQICGYDHFNERRFKLDDGILSLLNERGSVTSRLRYLQDANAFLMHDTFDNYLLPILELPPALESLGQKYKIFINSIPKSGTYLLEKILSNLGSRYCEFHLGAYSFHDNRGIPMECIHRSPHERQTWCRASVVMSLLVPGEHAVGHIEDREELKRVTADHTIVFNCVRNLKDVLVSLFRFKLGMVNPISAADRLWRLVEGQERFYSFLAFVEDKDVAHIRQVGEAMLGMDLPLLRYEELVRNVLPLEFSSWLNEREEGLSDRIQAVLPQSLGEATSTKSTVSSNYRDYWDEKVESFFQESGLADLNIRLGYGST